MSKRVEVQGGDPDHEHQWEAGVTLTVVPPIHTWRCDCGAVRTEQESHEDWNARHHADRGGDE